jgi:hypothetical protein
MPGVSKKRKANIAKNVGREQSGGRPRLLSTVVRDGGYVIVYIGNHLSSETLNYFMTRDENGTTCFENTIKNAMPNEGDTSYRRGVAPIFNKFKHVSGTEHDVDEEGGYLKVEAEGTSTRFGIDHKVMEDTTAREHVELLLQAINEVILEIGMNISGEGALCQRKDVNILASLDTTPVQAVHMDASDPSVMDTRQAGYNNLNKGHLGQESQIPFSLVGALGREATLLLSAYSQLEENRLLNFGCYKEFPELPRPLERVVIPPLHIVVFLQSKVHAGDVTISSLHVRLHEYYDLQSLPSTDTKQESEVTRTFPVKMLLTPEEVCKYYAYPATDRDSVTNDIASNGKCPNQECACSPVTNPTTSTSTVSSPPISSSSSGSSSSSSSSSSCASPSSSSSTSANPSNSSSTGTRFSPS